MKGMVPVVYESKVDALWDELAEGLDRSVKQYNEQQTDKTLCIEFHLDPDPRRIRASKVVYPCGYFDCRLDRGARAVVVTYKFAEDRRRARGPVERRFEIKATGDALILYEGAVQHLPKQFAQTVLDRFFERI